ncbi:class I SAM-dependent RNA methyltransferase, partial [candidate division KSB1 bacterium]|nr:class I SAM-dependent RNA methyltransferase [candidate division KSB1 bacterium]NIR73258.1 class I SAM-dependent RNA methyltransferase [candidate division KSB1 bacterium]NIS26964.1 class I SAM-dependent RNA methyltransferase [candidate division KSB1 bacterium]NIT73803.1 class I SAM-dependent RNA methyltransferase [candidate division KSB1 bacterium]NIU27708.1 class I SAM-dependent RNA methyltransferase [candidate division KSB1 bacterium]
MEPSLKRGTELNLEIQSLAFGGRGVARSNGLVVFVENSIPGQKVRARILRKKRGYAEARSVRVLEESSEAVTPRCPHFGECGGCRFQNLHYEAQLRHKHHQVVESLEHLGGFKTPPVRPTLSSPDPYYYRNKMEFSFGQQRWLTQAEIDSDEITKPKDFTLGLHVRGRFDKILDLDTCYLQSPFSAEVLSSVRQFALDGGAPAYTTKDHSGFWRHLVIREGKNTGETMINIVTAERPKSYHHVENLAQNLL